jgi:oligoribonuclease (3'-5' exoribonuclease)
MYLLIIVMNEGLQVVVDDRIFAINSQNMADVRNKQHSATALFGSMQDGEYTRLERKLVNLTFINEYIRLRAATSSADMMSGLV